MMMNRCRSCGERGRMNLFVEYGELRLLNDSWVCPRCYKEITVEVMRSERKMLERIAREFDLTPEDIWEVAASEIDFMPEEVGDDDAD